MLDENLLLWQLLCLEVLEVILSLQQSHSTKICDHILEAGQFFTFLDAEIPWGCLSILQSFEELIWTLARESWQGTRFQDAVSSCLVLGAEWPFCYNSRELNWCSRCPDKLRIKHLIVNDLIKLFHLDSAICRWTPAFWPYGLTTLQQGRFVIFAVFFAFVHFGFGRDTTEGWSRGWPLYIFIDAMQLICFIFVVLCEFEVDMFCLF